MLLPRAVMLQARAATPANVQPPEEKKSSIKKRKAESAQATQGRDSAELAKSLSETAVKEVPVKAKKQKKVTAAAAEAVPVTLAGTPKDKTEEEAVKPKKKKSKKAATASEAAGSLPPAAVVVPAVVVSPDVVVLPAASIQAAASSRADTDGAAQLQSMEGVMSGHASGKVPTGARAFKRVNDEEWLGKKGAWDNSYEAKFGNSGYGAKASQTLLQVRGKDFRHEKTKKKRGSYKGGIIDNNVNSFKFESDDE
ncbi:hypothetical protein WJX79_008866 [Trebouxia sp. C0005]